MKRAQYFAQESSNFNVTNLFAVQGVTFFFFMKKESFSKIFLNCILILLKNLFYLTLRNFDILYLYEDLNLTLLSVNTYIVLNNHSSEIC